MFDIEALTSNLGGETIETEETNIYYKANEGFFLTPEVGAVLITKEEHEEALEGQSKGLVIVPNIDGKPITVVPSKYPDAVWNPVTNNWDIDEDKILVYKKEQQEKIWEDIKKYRYNNGLGGVYIESIQVDGHKVEINDWFQTGEEEKTKYLGLDKVIDMIKEIDWKTGSNKFVKMNRPLLTAIFVAMVQTENADHINAEKHHLALLEQEDPTNYDYTTGWSKVYDPANPNYKAEE